MRVLVDAVQDTSAISGTDRVVRNVMERLPSLLPEAEFIVGVRRGTDLVTARPGVRLLPVGVSRRSWLVLAMPLFAARFRPDVTLGLHNCMLPPALGGRTICSVMDVIPFRMAEDYFPDPRLRFVVQTVMKRSLARADAVSTISRATADDLAALGLTSAPVTVAHIAQDSRFAPACAAEVAAVRVKYALPERFLLTIGSREPRKNLAGAVAAHRALPAAVRAGLPLVVAGAPWTRAGVDTVRDEALQEIGYVDDADLPAVYTAATAFLFLSLYEGFGLPPLEAMACGTPVVCSDVSSLPEATGGAAVLVPPSNPAAVAAGIQSVLSGPEREARISAGRARAAELTWDACAAAYAELIRSLA